MSRPFKDTVSKAQPITLDRPRKLMLTNYAWGCLEEAYESMPGALRGYAEMMTGHKAVTHAVTWLWALLQEEIRLDNRGRRISEQEELTREDVEAMIVLSDINEYKSRIADTILAFHPIPDPLHPALKMVASPGTGSGSKSFSGANTNGAAMSS